MSTKILIPLADLPAGTTNIQIEVTVTGIVPAPPVEPPPPLIDPPSPPSAGHVWALSSTGQGGTICGPTSGTLGTLRLLDQEFHVPGDVPAETEVVLALANYGDDAAEIVRTAVAASVAHMQSSAGLSWTQGTGPSLAAARKLPDAKGDPLPQARSPGWGASSAIPVTLAQRTDGGAYRVLRARAIGPAGSGYSTRPGWHVQQAYGPDIAACKADPRNTLGIAYAGTATASSSAIDAQATTITEAGAVMLAPITYFKVPTGHISVVVFGDSVYTQGVAPTGLGLGQLLHFKAQAAGARISACQRSQNGQTHAASLLCARDLLSLPVRPTHILVSGWSVNSGVSAAAFDACWADLQALHAECQALGVGLIVPTIIRQTGGWVASILAQNARIKSMPGVIVPDFEAAMTDPATGYTRADLMADAVHLSAAGINMAVDVTYQKLLTLQQ